MAVKRKGGIAVAEESSTGTCFLMEDCFVGFEDSKENK